MSPAAVLYVGDSVDDVRASQAAGMPVAAVLWGAGGAYDLRALRPDLLLDDPDALLALGAEVNVRLHMRTCERL